MRPLAIGFSFAARLDPFSCCRNASALGFPVFAPCHLQRHLQQHNRDNMDPTLDQVGGHASSDRALKSKC